MAKIGNFTPRPAVISGPRVVIHAPILESGQVDTTALGNRITPEEYKEKLERAENRAKFRPR